MKTFLFAANMKEVWETDSLWNSNVEASRWPSVIAQCLTTASRAADIMMRSAEHVILKGECQVLISLLKCA